MEMASRLLHGSIYPKIADSPHCVRIFQQRRLHRYLLYGYVYPREPARSPGKLFISRVPRWAGVEGELGQRLVLGHTAVPWSVTGG